MYVVKFWLKNYLKNYQINKAICETNDFEVFAVSLKFYITSN